MYSLKSWKTLDKSETTKSIIHSISILTTPRSHYKTDKSSRNIKDFQDFLNTCDDLHKGISELNINIEQSLVQKKKKRLKITEKNDEIRNDFYYQGLERIEYNKKLRKGPSIKDKLKKLMSSLPDIREKERFITAEDINTQDGLEFLTETKRQFGSKTEEKKITFQKQKKKKKTKKSLKDLLLDEPRKRLKLHRKSMPILGIIDKSLSQGIIPERSNKLPVLSTAIVVAMRAKNEANKLFVNKKALKTVLTSRKKSLF